MGDSRRSSDDPIVRSLTDRVETLQRRVHRLEQVATVLVQENRNLRRIVEETADELPGDSEPSAQPIEDSMNDIECDDALQPEHVLEAVASNAEIGQIDTAINEQADDESKQVGEDGTNRTI